MTDDTKFDDLVDFPATFTFRVIADAAPDLAETCQRLVETSLSRPVILVEEKPSKNGRFRSVRVSATVVDGEEIRSTYRALGSVEGLKLLL